MTEPSDVQPPHLVAEPPAGPVAGPGRVGFSVLVRVVPTRGARRVIVALRGEVDAAAVPALTGLREQLARWDAPVIVITSRVTFMDSTGLAAVLALAPPRAPLQLRPASHATHLVMAATTASPRPAAPSAQPPSVQPPS